MTPATQEKRAQFLAFMEKVLLPETAVQAIIGVGSIATGRMRPDSDIDIILFLDPYDLYIVPAEAYWLEKDNSFHSIFSEDKAIQQGLQLDFMRVDWQQWRDPAFHWPEEQVSALVNSWIVYDRHGEVTQQIQERAVYPSNVRQIRLDEAITGLDQHLGWGSPQKNWNNLGSAIAHDRLQSAYDYLVDGLFAYNRRWRIWRNRQMSGLLQLPWLPSGLSEDILLLANAPSLDYAGYMARVDKLTTYFTAFQQQLIADGTYQDPVGEAFIRSHEEPGRAWNMAEWNAKRQERISH
ncbi:nucleotidyltransferase domain-containing protein [Candidatus Leptofilum sp.]|uniref:nucleotidyltransferase domain-containing protein n=1 Tax=Candidatus Leptofilum sp. TaxID=3241576 RepID=UPI003B5CC77A